MQMCAQVVVQHLCFDLSYLFMAGNAFQDSRLRTITPFSPTHIFFPLTLAWPQLFAHLQ